MKFWRRLVWRIRLMKSASKLYDQLASGLYLMEHARWDTGYCCCGGAVDQHGWGDGHSPVDEGNYHLDPIYAETRKMVDQFKPPA